MKKIVLSAAILIASITASAQTAALSPSTKHYFYELKNFTAPDLMPDGFVYKQDAGGNFYISAMVKVSDPLSASQGLRSIGAFTGTRAGNIWTVQVPVANVAELVTVNGIAYIQLDEPVFPMLNQARRTTKVDSVHMGIGLPMPYSGKDVIMGVIDFGFDYNHPTLYDTTGTKYSVKKVWELNSTGTPPAGYLYGHEITDSMLIRMQGTDNAEQTHGAGTSGIASGSGFGSTDNRRFRGMAYESDMVFVGVRRDSIGLQWMQSGFSDFIDGIAYIFDYADAEGKPAVVNISWGSQSGPHDGSSLFNQACNNLSGPGKMVVMSAGNEGQERIHLSKTFTASDTLLKTALFFSPQTYKRTWVDAWGDTAKTFCMEVNLFSQGSAGSSTSMICIDGQTHTYELISANGNDTCFVELITSASEFNNKPRITANIFNRSTDTVAVTIKGTEGSIDVWDEYYYYGYKHGFSSEFRTLGVPGALFGNTASTVSDMGSATSVLLVGAYASKVSFTNINGANFSYSGYVAANKLVPFSSRGPMADGRISPDITAPGLTLATSMSSYDSSYTPTGDNGDLTISGYTHPVSGNTFYYAEFSGTSASAPAASGIVALMLQANPNLTPQQIKDIIIYTAIEDIHTGDLPNEGNNNWGHGKINAYSALKYVVQNVGLTNYSGVALDCILYPNPNPGNFNLLYNATQQELLKVEVIDLTGKTVGRFDWQVTAGANQAPFNLAYLSKGLYLVNVTSGAGTMSIRTVIE